jgi:hypothetical protein
MQDLFIIKTTSTTAYMGGHMHGGRKIPTKVIYQHWDLFKPRRGPKGAVIIEE